MLYEFEDEKGARVELDYRMGRAPKIGSWVTRGGLRLRRVPPTLSRPDVQQNVDGFVCYSQHPSEVASDRRAIVAGNEHAVITSRRQIEETVARSEGRITYGDGRRGVKAARWA